MSNSISAHMPSVSSCVKSKEIGVKMDTECMDRKLENQFVQVIQSRIIFFYLSEVCFPNSSQIALIVNLVGML